MSEQDGRRVTTPLGLEVERKVQEGQRRLLPMLSAAVFAFAEGARRARAYPTLRRSFARWIAAIVLVALAVMATVASLTTPGSALLLVIVQVVHGAIVVFVMYTSLELVRDEDGWVRNFFGVANALTVGRLLLAPSVVLTLVFVPDAPALAPLAVVLFVVVAGSDMLDGTLARALHQRSVFGRTYDPLSDVVFNPAIALGLTVIHVIPWWLTAILMLRYWVVLMASVALYFVHGPYHVTSTIFGKVSGAVLGVVIGLAVLKLCVAPGWLTNDIMRASFIGSAVLSGGNAVFLITRGFLMLFGVWSPSIPPQD